MLGGAGGLELFRLTSFALDALGQSRSAKQGLFGLPQAILTLSGRASRLNQ